MKHLLTTAKLALAAASIASAPLCNAASDYVYIMGCMIDGSPTYYPANTEYAERLERHRLFEVEGKPNVYSGVFELTANGPIKFHTELIEDSDLQWQSNVVSPPTDVYIDYGVSNLTERGNSHVYDGRGVYYRLADRSPDGWYIPKGMDGLYTVTLDLNDPKNVTVTLVPADALYMVRGSQPTPTLETAADYVTIKNPDYLAYFGEEEKQFSLYDMSSQKWFNPAETFTLLYGSPMQVDGRSSDTRGYFTLPNWPGGIVNISSTSNGNPVVELLPDKPVKQPGTTTTSIATLIGDFTYWAFNQAFQSNFSEPRSEFDISLPAGAKVWKLVLGNDWDAPGYGVDYVGKAADGTFVVYLTKDGDNITFDKALTEQVTGHVDLSGLSITFPAGTPLTATATVNDGSYPAYVDEMLLEIQGYGVTPWAGASAAVMSTVTHLPKQPDGTYKCTMTLDRPFRFISSRAPMGVIYEVIAPDSKGTLREVTMPEAMGLSSAECTTSAKGGWWTVPSELVGTQVEVTIDNSGVTPKITFYAESREPVVEPIYLVGSIQGWDVSSPSHPLYPTDNGGYYGSFPVSAADADYFLFRFSTTLGDWGGEGRLPSFGSGPYDFTQVDAALDSDGSYSGTGVPGMGNWSITNWSGDTFYAYVNIDERRVIFANHPIAEAGTLVTEVPEKNEMYIYNEATGNFYTLANEKKDGVYKGVISASDPANFSFRLLKELPLIARDEAEWGAKGAFYETWLSDGPDMFGISEAVLAPYTHATTPDPVTLPLDSDRLSNGYYVTYDSNTGHIYFENAQSNIIFLTGAIADGKELTYANRGEWDDLCVNLSSGGIVNIPTGKFDFTPRCLIFNDSYADRRESKTVAWDSNGMMIFPPDYSTSRYNGILDYSIKCPSWYGGLVAIRLMSMADVSPWDFFDCTLTTGKGENTARFLRNGEFTYQCNLKYTDADASSTLNFILRQPEEAPVGNTDYSFNLTSAALYLGYGGHAGEEYANVIRSSNGIYTASLGVNGRRFVLPGLSGSGELTITVDIASMTMTAVNSGTEAPIYEVVAEAGSALDGAVIIPSTENAEAMVLSNRQVPAPAAGEAIEFNFARPDGSVLVPAEGDAQVTFGPDGIFTGKLAVASTQRTMSRSALRTAAASSAKWQVRLPDGVNGTILHAVINEAEGSLTIFSSAHNTDTYYISYCDASTYDELSMTSLLNLKDGHKRTLTRKPDGTFTGEFDSDGNAGGYFVRFHGIPDGNGSGAGIYTPAYTTEAMTIDLTDAGEVSRPALAGEYSQWYLYAPKGVVTITYDPEMCTLTMVRGSASIDDVAAEATAELTLTPGDGCIHVYAPEATVIEVHNLSGALVKRASVPAGHSTLAIAPGFYTAAGTKLLVK